MDLFKRIITKLEESIDLLNQERVADDGFRLPKAKIILLGQFSLLANPKISSQLNIPATMDVDAKLEADWVIKEAFKKILKSEGLDYDEDSGLIWIPPKSTFELLHDSLLLRCESLSPVYGLLSKAIKAKEKNRVLVRDAIALFGKELVELITKYGGDPEYFLKD
jgi:hypothetical protein